ncbi:MULTISPECIES: glycosyltransferase family 2 protein [Clostridium]|uniref:glycosyltransferase family 2 protein n=1 Tax=Clostridium TaxID=1485 RepID=UPI00290C9CA8|nr:glycosyltransferase family 2 protein [Clostridium sp.]
MYRFSILVPVYNVEEYLRECVESVLSQTFKDYELILVDDGSTDASCEICDKYRSENIKVYHKKNEGLLLARREAISHARGEYCMFLDSDDTLEPNCLEEINCVIEKHSADLVIFNLLLWDDKSDKKILRKPVYDSTCIFSTQNIEELRKKFITTSLLNNMVIKAVKTEILKADPTDYKNQVFSDYGEDAIQTYYIFDKCQKIIYMPNGLYDYRKNDSSITRGFLTFDKIKNKVRPGTEILKNEYMQKWKLTSPSISERVCCNRLESLRVIFSSNYLQINDIEERKRYIHNNWRQLIGEENYKYLNSKKIQFTHRIEIKSIINQNFLVLEFIRKIRCLRVN